MLEALLPGGLDAVPDGVDSATRAQLGHAYKYSGRLSDALRSYAAWYGADLDGMAADFAAAVHLLMGHIRDAVRQSRRANEVEDSTLFKFHAGRLAVAYGVMGQVELVEPVLSQHAAGPYWHPSAATARAMVWAGEYELAVEHCRRAQRDEQYNFSDSHHLGSSDTAVLVEAQVLGRFEGDHEPGLLTALSQARARFDLETELWARRVLAEAQRQRGALDEAEETLADFWDPAVRSSYRLHMALARLVQARIARARNAIPLARAAAADALREAECDGEQWMFRLAFTEAEELLAEIS